MHIKLKVLRGASAGREIGVKVPRFVIGRAEECNLRVNSEAISRQHCVICFDNQEVLIRDLGSRNGTYVNGERLEAPRRLVLGDQLRVGPLEFLVTFAQVAHPPAGVAGTVRADASEQDMAGLISDWLSEANDTERRAKPSEIETRVYRVDDTARIPVAPNIAPNIAPGGSANVASPEAGEPTASPAATSGATDELNREASGGANEAAEADSPAAFGKKTPPKNQAPKDTQEAAAQTLRKLLNRGGN